MKYKHYYLLFFKSIIFFAFLWLIIIERQHLFDDYVRLADLHTAQLIQKNKTQENTQLLNNFTKIDKENFSNSLNNLIMSSAMTIFIIFMFIRGLKRKNKNTET
ncbi:hypothetical protein KHA90_24390 [Flavobacterium psychroterrae]|uniref:DUF4199 domain-containing protein n=1 Tax=Flavobacterium psychroterrae TaxID=2133767 RepID=A0ABS5PKE9_9FLAO|nr:hypothetical protein [Flavobacterium psychroterrae]MBS7234145.1 hypothetical protein [Flavobacterium psychroterrae]